MTTATASPGGWENDSVYAAWFAEHQQDVYLDRRRRARRMSLKQDGTKDHVERIMEHLNSTSLDVPDILAVNDFSPADGSSLKFYQDSGRLSGSRSQHWRNRS